MWCGSKIPVAAAVAWGPPAIMTTQTAVSAEVFVPEDVLFIVQIYAVGSHNKQNVPHRTVNVFFNIKEI